MNEFVSWINNLFKISMHFCCNIIVHCQLQTCARYCWFSQPKRSESLRLFPKLNTSGGVRSMSLDVFRSNICLVLSLRVEFKMKRHAFALNFFISSKLFLHKKSTHKLFTNTIFHFPNEPQTDFIYLHSLCSLFLQLFSIVFLFSALIFCIKQMQTETQLFPQFVFDYCRGCWLIMLKMWDPFRESFPLNDAVLFVSPRLSAH